MAPGAEEEVISLQQPESSLHEAVKNLLVNLLPEWRNVNASRIQVNKISGGITNVLLKLTPPPGLEAKAVALRVFGDKTEELIDRHRELRILRQLNAAGFGAPILATFGNGRVEQFIPYRPLKDQEMSQPDYAALIAKRLAQLHGVPIDEPKQPEIFSKIREWLEEAKLLRFKHEQKQQRFQQIDLSALQQEAAELEAACQRLHSPIVFSHNDLLSGNVMVPENASSPEAGQQPMQFIDFEYSCFMHRGFDWGNHFNEYAGFECDYSRYPDDAQTQHFLRCYLTEANSNQPGEQELRDAAVEAHVFALVSHQFWGTWALFQAAYSAIEFDYLEYSELRWNEYRRRKAECLAQIRS